MMKKRRRKQLDLPGKIWNSPLRWGIYLLPAVLRLLESVSRRICETNISYAISAVNFLFGFVSVREILLAKFRIFLFDWQVLV